MKPIILIPARMASTRLPNKPLADIGGAPMIVQVWRRAMESRAGDVVVACDAEAIAGVIEQQGGLAILTDPNLPSGSDRIYRALEQIDPEKRYDIVVNLQGDMPTIDPAVIARVVHVLDDPRFDVATLAAPITSERDRQDPAVVKVLISLPRGGRVGEGADLGGAGFRMQQECPPPNLPPAGGGMALSFSRAYTPGAHHHIGIYAYRRKALERFVSLPPSPLERQEKLEQLRAMEDGMAIGVAIVDDAPIGVDTEETLALARSEYEKQFQTHV